MNIPAGSAKSRRTGWLPRLRHSRDRQATLPIRRNRRQRAGMVLRPPGLPCPPRSGSWAARLGATCCLRIPARSLAIPNYMASPYVPIDSWIYPSLERLIALGYMQSNMLGMRPWTRMACARMLEEAGEKLQNDGVEAGEAGKIYRTLTNEFATETRAPGWSPQRGRTCGLGLHAGHGNFRYSTSGRL